MKKTTLFKQITSISIITALLTGCAVTNQQGTTAKPTNNTTNGAIIGAMVGAMIGLATSNHKGKRAVIGGAVGAALGGAIGYSMDEQAKQMAQELDTKVDNSKDAALNPDTDLIVSNTDNYVKIMLRDSMVFETNSAIPTQDASRKIAKIADVLNTYPNTIVQVVGFTDNRGSYEYNQKLSEKRASNVGNTLYNSGIPNLIYSKGCSFQKAIAPNTTKENMGLNRRVEIYLYPNQESIIDACVQ